jgi:hypothetical protein
LAQELKKMAVVPIVEEDILPIVASGHDME